MANLSEEIQNQGTTHECCFAFVSKAALPLPALHMRITILSLLFRLSLLCIPEQSAIHFPPDQRMIHTVGE